MARPSCPDCAVPLQVLFVERGGGRSDVQVDRCPACHGLWFEVGELEDTVAKLVPQERLGAPTDRRCPACSTTMETVLLPGAVPAETCGSCRGVWLDEGELKELGGAEPNKSQRRVAPRAGPVPRAGAAAALSGGADDDFEDLPEHDEPADEAPVERKGGFDCAGCGARTPFSDAHGTARGLVCGQCTPQVQEVPPGPEIEIRRRRTLFGTASRTQFSITRFDLSGILDYFL